MKEPKTFSKTSSQVAKGTAVIWLLIYHLFYRANIVEDRQVLFAPLTENGFNMVASFGHACVALFVFLSAYGLTKGVLDSGEEIKATVEKSFRRLWKLMSGFIALYVSVWVVFGWKMSYSAVYGQGPQGILYMLTDAVGLADVFGTPSMNETWWYMKMAYALILLVPLGAHLMKKIGYAILPIALLVPIIFTVNYDTEKYLFTIALGMAAAYGSWFDRLLKLKIPMVVKWLAGILGTVALIYIRYNSVILESYIQVVDAAGAFFLGWTAAELLAGVPGLKQVLALIGKNSLNIFLVHSFFYLLLWQDVVYAFRPMIVTLVILLALSLVYSLALNVIKKYIVVGLDQLRKKGKNNGSEASSEN